MDRYQITITFKDHRFLEITLDTDKDMRDVISDGMNEEDILLIGNYIISAEDILYIQVEGERLIEKPRRKKVQDNRKKK